MGESSNIFTNPFNSNQMKLDEEELNFIPFDHTSFSHDNLKAMAMLIILFERLNPYLNFK